MNETIKTITFLATAAVVLLVVWLTRPRSLKPTDKSELPKTLFAEFDDPLAAASLEIIEFDEDTATLRPFKVARVDEEWSIPSHSNYPADAENQLAEVAASFIGLKPLDVAGDTPADHQLYGVVEPDRDKLSVGDTGVGTSVEIRDKSDDPLLALIVGERVPDREELRYVRIPGKGPVYTTKLDISKLSTKFEDWIEDDLLKLNTWDVKQVQINDYSVDMIQGLLDPRSRMTLEYDDSASEWKMAEDQTFDREKGDWVAMEMAEDEELDTSTLNDMKYALDDLKIVDVRRKPKGLSANLKNTGPLQLDMEALQSLQNRGFYIHQNQLYSSEGEVNILMKDGVQYVLRFGQIAAGTEGSSESDEKEGEEPEEESGGVNRYLFVMAEFNANAIPQPELEPLPGEEKADEASPAEKPEEKATGGNGGAEESTEPAEGAEAKSEPAAGDEPPADAPEEKAEETSEGQEKPEEKSDEPAAEEGDEKSETDAQREWIEKENQRKQDEYDEKVKKGQERVKELNDRFADWYYVISDEVYQKIHLGRDDVVKKKEKEEESDEAESDEEEAAESDPMESAAGPAGDAQPEEEGSGVSESDKLKKEGLDEKPE
jgi:hypothetical protein